ncbi:hypothetical protein MJH12_17335 [bacterium]|nr:hypothetical protein [bacterium]
MKDFFAKLKEKLASFTKKKAETSSESTKESSTESSVDDISLDGEQGESNEKKADKISDEQKLKKKKLIKGVVLGIVVFTLFIGGAYLTYQYVRDYPKVEAAGERFFNMIKKKRYNQAYMGTTKTFRDKVSEKEFKYSFLGSSYLFENILEIEANEEKYIKKGKRFNLQGKVIYQDKSKGDFKLILMKGKIKNRSTFLVDGFEVSSKSNEKKVRKLAYKAVVEFLKTLSAESNLDSFRHSFHESVTEKMGKEAGVRFSVLYSKHKEAGYTSHEYLEKDLEVTYNTQITYTGISKTKLGSEFIGKITVYYDKGAWYVVGFSFHPKDS